MESEDKQTHLDAIAKSMDIGLYQRVDETQAAALLHLNKNQLNALRDSKKISFIQVDEQLIEYFGFHLVNFLIASVSPAEGGLQQSPDAASPPSERILRKQEVIKITSLSKTTLWRYEKKGIFPKHISLGVGAIGSHQSEVAQWLATRPQS